MLRTPDFRVFTVGVADEAALELDPDALEPPPPHAVATIASAAAAPASHLIRLFRTRPPPSGPPNTPEPSCVSDAADSRPRGRASSRGSGLRRDGDARKPAPEQGAIPAAGHEPGDLGVDGGQQPWVIARDGEHAVVAGVDVRDHAKRAAAGPSPSQGFVDQGRIEPAATKQTQRATRRA